MTGAYLTGLPVKFMRKVAGFSVHEGGYSLPRAHVDPSPQLLRLVWPQIEPWQARVKAASDGKSFKDGGLNQPDLAADRFLSLLKHLRRVFLQDAALLQLEFPAHPIFGHPVFHHADWLPFSRQVQVAQRNGSESGSAVLERYLPEVNSCILASGKSLSGENAANFKRLDDRLDHEFAENRTFRRACYKAFTAFYEHASGQQSHPPSSETAPDVRGVTAQGAFFSLRPSTPPSNPALACPTTHGPGSTSEGRILDEEILPRYQPYDCRTVQDLWREWKLGMNGQRPMEELEAKWGIKWRQGKGQGPWWTRRKRIIDQIELVRTTRGCSFEEAVAEVELLRASNNWSINRLYEHYLQEAKKQKK